MKIRSSKSKLQGSVWIPGSKSHTIRGLVIATLAEGESELLNPLYADDTISCFHACEMLGAKIQKFEADARWLIQGVGKNKIKPQQATVDMGNSGTSLRLLSGAVSLTKHKISFDGDASLRTRLMKPLLDSLTDLGARTESNGGHCPLTIQGPILGGKTTVSGLSSQFLSSLLICTPLAMEDSEIFVNDLHEKPYVGITLDWLKEQGIRLHVDPSWEHFKVPGRQFYKPFKKIIAADFSTACFPLCAAALTQSKITLLGLDFKDAQGDKEIFEHLKKMGAIITHQEKASGNETLISAEKGLNGIEIDLNATPDALPILAVVGCFAKGKTILKNVEQARVKECDRIAAMTQELRKMGAKIEEKPDGMILHESPLHAAKVHGHGDHRIVMALTIAGLMLEGETVVDTAEAFAVTYPHFMQDLQKLGANLSSL